MTVDVVANLKTLNDRIVRACARVGRPPSSVRLLGVVKGQPLGRIREAVEAGQTRLAQSYVQEFQEHRPALADSVEWHFIGRLQSNKIKYLVGQVALIHSVDRRKVLDEIEQRAGAAGVVADCLLEVNVGEEESKGGAPVEQARDLLGHALSLPHVGVRGLMSIPPFLDDPEAMRPYHRRLAALRERLEQTSGHPLPELSMGMSLDMDVAIEEGATYVRVGTDLFGPRLLPEKERT